VNGTGDHRAIAPGSVSSSSTSSGVPLQIVCVVHVDI
jgi:hypothetical protein